MSDVVNRLKYIKFDTSNFYIQQNSGLESATEFALPSHLLLFLSMKLLQVSMQLLCLLVENIY